MLKENFQSGDSPVDFLNDLHDRQKSRSFRATTISDDIVDVEFEDVSKDDQSSKEDKKRTFDKKARANEIVEAGEKLIMEKLKDVSSDKRMAGFCTLMVFALGAEWADDHPKSSFPSDHDWWVALEKYAEGITEESPMGFHGKLLFNMAFALGTKWADANPPKYEN